jgi:hypothetical protein
MKLKDLFEMPMKDISFHGGDEPESFSKMDLEVMKAYAVKKRYHEKLTKVPFDLYVYILNDDAVAHFGEMFPEGEIKIYQRHIGYAADGNLDGSDRDELVNVLNSKHTVFSEIRANKVKSPKAVHFVMGDNYSDSDQMTITPWILIHRLVHALPTIRFVKIMDDLMEKFISLNPDENGDIFLKRDIAEAIGYALGIRSMKQEKTGYIDSLEIPVEIMTKCLISGKLKPEPVDDQFDPLIKKICQAANNEVPQLCKLLQGRVFYV